jgi:hypothetical protein
MVRGVKTDIVDTKVSFEGGPSPRLEMADLFARESMKALDRTITTARPKPRASYLALDGTGHFKFIEQDRALDQEAIVTFVSAFSAGCDARLWGIQHTA